MNFVAGSGVAVVITLLAGHLAPHRPTARVPTSCSAGNGGTAPSPRGRRRRGHLMSTFVAAAAVATVAALVGVAVAVAAVGASAVEVARRRRRRTIADRQAIAAALPDAIEFLVLIVHAGRSPTQAVLEAARYAPEATRVGFAATAHRLQRGQGLGEALTALVDELGPGARPIADGIAAAERYGLPLAPVLDSLSDQAHAARRRIAEAEARRLPVRLSFPLVVCTLPSFALLAVVPAVLGTISSLRGYTA